MFSLLSLCGTPILNYYTMKQQKEFIIINDASEIIQNTIQWLWSPITNKKIITNIADNFIDTVAAIVSDAFHNEHLIKILETDRIRSFFEQNIEDNATSISLLPEWLYWITPTYHISITRMYNGILGLEQNKWFTLQTRQWTNIKHELEKLDTIDQNQPIIIIDDWLNSWTAVKIIIQKLLDLWLEKSQIKIIVANNFSNQDTCVWVEIKALNTINTNNLVDVFEARDVMLGMKHSWWAVNIEWGIHGITYSRPAIAEGKSSIPSQSSKIYCQNIIQANLQLREILNLNHISLWELQNNNHRKSILDTHSKTRTTIMEALLAEQQFIS
jgi:hypothetical protein